MKKRILTFLLAAVSVAAVVALVMILSRAGDAVDESTLSSDSGVESYIPTDVSTDVTYSTVKLLKSETDTQESSYRVSADLPATDLTCIGQVLKDKIENEWDTYSGLTEIQRLASSKSWGLVGVRCDDWAECENAIGFSLYNPLESVSALDKVDDLITDGSHIRVMADSVSDRTLKSITVNAEYRYRRSQVTLTATVRSDGGEYSTGGAFVGIAEFEQRVSSTGSGIPVLIVTPIVENNLGYFSEDYYAPIAYWVRNGVFYSLRVHGLEENSGEIREALDFILSEL